MNFAQLHEALRLEILRRIDRGVLTGALLARQTGFKQAHISNFLHSRRLLSLKALDKVLIAQRLSVADLLAGQDRTPAVVSREARLQETVPLVSQASAIHDLHIASRDVIDQVTLPPGTIESLGKRRATSRRDWQRFVAIRVTTTQAEAMAPLLSPHAIVLLDRHYISLTPYRAGSPTLYAVASGNTLLIRYVTLDGNQLILRPYSLSHPIELLELASQQALSHLIIGRACLTVAEL